MQGPPTGFQQDLKIFIYHRAPREPLNSCKIVIEGTETGTTVLCDCLRSRLAHGNFRRSRLFMRSRNAHGHLTRAIFATIFRKKARDQMEHPHLTPAFNRYRKNPSVWTHCLGKYDVIKIPWNANLSRRFTAESLSRRSNREVELARQAACGSFPWENMLLSSTRHLIYVHNTCIEYVSLMHV